MKTTFNASCSNWKDNDLPLSYEYSYEVKGVRTLFFDDNGATGKTVTSNTILPVGDTKNNNKLVLHVKIKDNFGGTTSLNFTLKVRQRQRSHSISKEVLDPRGLYILFKKRNSSVS